MNYEVVPPDPAGTIGSLSALGYTLEAAIADLVDNSIDANASSVEVVFHWSGFESYVAVVDDGIGMEESDVLKAMAIAARGPHTPRQRSDLGRFGMGLKTASFSQASRLTVWSWKERKTAACRIWDLDHVVATGEWQLLRTPNGPAQDAFKRLTARVHGSGTVVLWQGLTKIVDELGTLDDDGHRHFLDEIARVEAHLAMTFARFLAGRKAGRKRQLTLRVNGNPVAPWDPFLEWHESTLARPVETLEVENQRVVVRPYVLPPKRRLTDEQYRAAAGPRGWLEQQGFYVYRNDRLIVAGGWLGLVGFRNDEKHVLARIAVDIPASVDAVWSVDVKKATARPPLQIRGSLGRTGKATRADAHRVMSSISKITAREKADDLSFVWRPDKSSGDLRLRLNWQHPLVREALQTSSDGRPVVKALLQFIEETVPVSALRVMFDREEDRDYEPFSAAPPEEVISVAERMYGAYISQGLTPIQAGTRLRHTSPFDEYPDLLSMLQLA